MTKAPISLQDLRRKIYCKAKAEPTWRSARVSVGRGGVGSGCMKVLGCSIIGRSKLVIHRQKRSQHDRSHKPCEEVSRKAQCGKSARWV